MNCRAEEIRPLNLADKIYLGGQKTKQILDIGPGYFSVKCSQQTLLVLFKGNSRKSRKSNVGLSCGKCSGCINLVDHKHCGSELLLIGCCRDFMNVKESLKHFRGGFSWNTLYNYKKTCFYQDCVFELQIQGV